MNPKKNKKVLLIMPPFWDPICPPQGIVSLRSYLEKRNYDVHIADFNIDGNLFRLQRKYFELGMSYFPQWKFLNIYRNGPRYFARHQLVTFYSSQHESRYKELIRHILNFDGKSICTEQMIDSFNKIIEEIFNIVASKTQELMDRINPDVVGCTMLESTFPSSLVILKKVKEINPKTATILGGPGPIMGNTVDDGILQKIISSCNWIDTIISGEGERLTELYLEGYFGDKNILTIQDLTDPGLTTGPKDTLLDIHELPIPNYDGLPVKNYLWLSMFTSRGCPFKCAFCVENRYWVRFRQKSIDRVINEISELSARYDKEQFYICDSLTNHIATPLSNILKEDNKRISWDCYMRITPECLDEEKVRLWATGGMARARIGIESGSRNVLKLMNKGIDPEEIEKALINFAKNGIYTSTLWMAGFPGEREEDFQESMRFFSENHKYIFQADIWEFISSPRELSASEVESSDFLTKPAYPEEFDDLLLIKYYDLENRDAALERFERINKFERLRMKLGVPNPYTLKELIEAQDRWEELGHK